MVTYLDHNLFCRGAKHFCHADNLTRWRKRKNLPHNAARVGTASIQALANRICSHFHVTEVQRKNCAVPSKIIFLTAETTCKPAASSTGGASRCRYFYARPFGLHTQAHR